MAEVKQDVKKKKYKKKNEFRFNIIFVFKTNNCINCFFKVFTSKSFINSIISNIVITSL